jgi:hypothetical protein
MRMRVDVHDAALSSCLSKLLHLLQAERESAEKGSKTLIHGKYNCYQGSSSTKNRFSYSYKISKRKT